MSRSTNKVSAAATALVAASAPIVSSNPKWQVGEADAKLASAVDLSALTTKSAQMRALSAVGLKNGPISRILSAHYNKEVKYQHVRNVLMQPAPTATPATEVETATPTE